MYIQFTVFIALLSALLAYVFYTPLPEGTEQPWRQLLGRSLVRIMFGSADIAEKFGYNGINFFRALADGNPKITPDEILDINDSKFDGVDVRIYKPKHAQENGPGLVYIHGGGWIYGTIASYDKLVRKIARTSGFVIVSIGYRRAPEYIFPIPFEDCLTATRYFFQHAQQYDVDPARIGLVGDSAGGNIAAAVTMKLSKDEGTKMKPKFQALIYPALQALDLELPSYRTYNDDSGPFILAKTLMTKFWLNYGEGNYKYLLEFLANNHTTSKARESKFYKYIDRKNLPEKYLTADDKSTSSQTGSDELFTHVSKWLLDPYFAPLLASDEDLKTLPPTHILTAEHDPLRDDGFLYAHRLRSMQKEVIHSHFDGVCHGFFNLDYLDSADRAMREMIQFWNSIFNDDKFIKMNLGIS